MLNMLKMDLYRMLRTKAMYIVWLFMIVAVAASSLLLKEEYRDQEIQEQNFGETGTDNVNVGMSVSLPTPPQEKISLYDVSYANIQGKFFALFVVIFAVIFATADLNSGYIKNFGGQVRNRWMLVLSKGIVLGLYTVMTMLLFLAVQAASNLLFFGYLKLGPARQFFSYIGTEMVLHWAMALIVMTLAVLIHNNAFSMVAAVCLCMNLMVVCYRVLDAWFAKMGTGDFTLLDYTVTGKISMLAMDVTGSGARSALLVGGGFIIGACALGCLIFQKRDIQ